MIQFTESFVIENNYRSIKLDTFNKNIKIKSFTNFATIKN